MSMSTDQIAQIDASGMLALTDQAARRAEQAYDAALALAGRVATEAAGHKAVLVCGMGGSAISGDLWHDALADSGQAPITVWRAPTFPAWAGPETLVVLMSYSGETAETLAAGKAALAAGCRVIGVTSGGQLAPMLEAAGKPVVPVPGGLQPRVALPELFYSLLGATSATEGLSITEATVRESIRVLADVVGRNGHGQAGLAYEIAAACKGGMPFLIGLSPFTSAVAKRWQTQLNENSKVMAHVACFPELTHNEIVNLEAMTWAPYHLIVLDDPAKPALLAGQMSITLAMLSGRWLGEHRIEGQGESRLARQLSLVALGDYVSIYLAFLRQLDPTPVDAIRALKQRMQELT